jgi:hypothetical protein
MKPSEVYGFLQTVNSFTETRIRTTIGKAKLNLNIYARRLGISVQEVVAVISEAVNQYQDSPPNVQGIGHKYCTQHNVVGEFHRTGKLEVDGDHLDGLLNILLQHVQRTEGIEGDAAIQKENLRFEQALLLSLHS